MLRPLPPAAALGALSAVCCALSCATAPGPDVLLVVVDTLRADRVGSYGYPRPTTPRIDALASRGVRFANASSTSSWTLPAHASLFTGRFPIEHGATQEHTELDRRSPTLAELLAERGYATFGASGNGVVSRQSGLARGFGEWVETWRSAPRTARPAEHPNVVALREFLAGLEPGRPFFGFVNYVECHGPYEPPEPWRSRFLRPGAPPALVRSATRRGAADHYAGRAPIRPEEFAVLSDLYDGEVAHADALVGALVDALEASGRLADTLLIVTSDHGENLGEHGHFRHVFSLYHTTVRIPLVVVLPDGARAGEVVREPVSLIDVFATVLAAAGVPGDRVAHRGRNLLAPPESLPEAPVFAEYYFPLQALGLFDERTRERKAPALAPLLRRLRSVEWRGRRLIWSSDGDHELYDLARDPAERRDLSRAPTGRAAVHELGALLDAYVAEAGGESPLPDEAARVGASIGAFGDLDPETEAQLRELGYLAERP